MSPITIRRETEADIPALRALITRAYTDDYHAWHNEQVIVEKLRDADELVDTMVAVRGLDIIGFVGATKVAMSDGTTGWFALGPLAVEPDSRRQGVGTALIAALIEKLQGHGAAGVVALGDAEFYAQFGFHLATTLRSEHLPEGELMVYRFSGPEPTGSVRYHHAFTTASDSTAADSTDPNEAP